MVLNLNKKKTISSILTLILFLSIHAQKNIKGIYIINAYSKIPLQEVSVIGDDNKFNLLTDNNGFIDYKKIPPTVNKIIFSCIGYQTKILEILQLKFLNNIEIINLIPKISSFKEINVTVASNKSIFKTISDLDIHLRPINNAQDVLRMVPGLFTGQHAGGGKAEQIFLRGFDLDHGTDINISVDGMPVNMVSHAHGQGYADLHFVIPELIDKVNFNKGPYFAEKGNFTTAGFVEFKTKDYLENNFAKVELGQFNTFRNIAGFNLLKPKGNKRNESLFLVGESSFTKGYFESPQNFSRFNGMLKYHKNINYQNTLTSTFTHFQSKWNASGQIPNRSVENGLVGYYGAIDNTEGGKTSRQNINIQLQTKLNNGGVLSNQIFYSKYKFELYSNFTFYKVDTINGDQIRQKENRDIMGYNGSYQKEFYLGKLKSEIKAGIQARNDYVKNIELTRTKDKVINTAAIMLGDVNELNVGAFYSQKISFSKKLDVTTAFRTDCFFNQYNDKNTSLILTSKSTIISPKLNFNYYVNKKVQLYLYNGKGFHSNDTRVAVLQNGKKVLPPAFGSDLGSIFKVNKNLVVQSALWYLWLDQEFVYVGDEGVIEAGGQTRRVGVDLSARYQVSKNIFADIDVSLSNPRALGVDKIDSYVPLAPGFTSVGGLTYRKENGFNGSLRYRFMNNRPANENNSVIAKGYFIMDAAINYTKKKWELSLSVQNILNTKWKETQFETESKLQNEIAPVSEIHFTPGTPFFAKCSFTIFF